MIDDLLTAATQTGDLAGLTLYPTVDGRWQAATTLDRFGWQVTVADTPGEAVRRALTAFAGAPQPVLDLFS